MTVEAEARLEAIQEATELGSVCGLPCAIWKSVAPEICSAQNRAVISPKSDTSSISAC